MRHMRGDHHEPDSMFSYVSPEQRIPKSHPLRSGEARLIRATYLHSAASASMQQREQAFRSRP